MRGKYALIVGLMLFSSALTVLIPQEASAFVLRLPHDPIRIDNDTEFAAMATLGDWQGNGTMDNPYVIGNFNISGGFDTDPIFIGNTTVHFRIEFCALWEADDIVWPYLTASGMTLYNVTNGNITHNDIADVIDDITLIHCTDVDIGSNVLRCTGDAIAVYDSERTQVLNNDFAYSARGVQSENSNNSLISGNTFLTLSEYSVVLGYSNSNVVSNNEFENCSIHIILEHADENTIRDCNFSSGQSAIRMMESNWNLIAGNSFDPTIAEAGVNITVGTNNSILNNSFGPSNYSVVADLAHDLIVKNNTCPNNYIGVYANESNRATVEKNTFTVDYRDGVFLENSDYFRIENNSVTQCGVGIEIVYSDYGEMRNNNCSMSHYSGLMTTESHYNTISGNDFSGSPFGIDLSYGDSHTTISRNKFDSNSVWGIRIGDANQNTIVHNTIQRSASFGMYISGSTGNSIYFNIFVLDNGAGVVFDALHKQAWDDNNLNQWNSSEGFGNYWGDWRTPDSNNDCIVDLPYKLYGMGIDHYPLKSVVSNPRNLAVTAGDAYANLSWDAPNYTAGSSVKFYRIYRENPGGSMSVMQVQGDVTAHSDTSVRSWKTYVYHVTAVNVYGEGAGSDEVGVLIPDETKPSVNITYPDDGMYGSGYSMLVEWTGSDLASGISQYEIMLDSGMWLSVGTNTNHTYSSLTNGTHVVTVKAVDNASNSNTTSVMFKIGVGTISGRIMSGGLPVITANVSLETGEQTTTDSNGYFTLEAYAGPHTLKVNKEGYDQLTRDLTLEPGQIMNLEQMEMKKSGIDPMWAIVAIIVIAAVVVLILVVLRARRH